MFLGLRTVIYMVDDMPKAKAWYDTLLGIAPYFDEPFYIGYNVGGYELGLHPKAAHIKAGNTPVSYWGVSNIEEAFERMKSLSAKEYEPIQDVGGGIKVAAFFDPFGNVIGVIENPHFTL